jgi:hypothetical protein
MFNELSEKIAAETNPALKERWVSMADCLSSVLQNNQRTLLELEEAVSPDTKTGVQTPPAPSQ